MKKAIINLWGASQGSSLAITGSLNSPAVGNSTMAQNSTWTIPQSISVASTLKKFDCYATQAGTIKLKVLTPGVGGYTVSSEQTLTIVGTGLKSFSVAAGTMTPMSVPAYGLIAFYTSSSGGAIIAYNTTASTVYGLGYWQATGDISGSALDPRVTGSATSTEVQIQFTLSYSRSSSPPAYIYNEDFAGTTTPSGGWFSSGSAWSFPGGKASPGATGLANRLNGYYSNVCDYTASTSFKFTTGTERPFLAKGGGIIPSVQGSIVEADIANNRLVIYMAWDGSNTLTSVRTNFSLPTITLTIGTIYTLQIVKVGRIITFSISDGVLTDSFQINGVVVLSTAGYGDGTIALGSLSGTGVEFYSAKLSNTVVDPSYVGTGDSLTVGFYSGANTTGYARLIIDDIPGDIGWACGVGGFKSRSIIKIVLAVGMTSMPNYISVLAGTNNAGNDSDMGVYLGEMINMYNLITNLGSTPVIFNIPPQSVGSQNTRVIAMNASLAGTGWRLVDASRATTLNNDGVTFDPALFFDAVHPNGPGHGNIYAQAVIDWPEIIN